MSESSEKEPTKKLQVGVIVDKQYKVCDKLGEGGFGLVLEVIHVKTNEHYAMKVELRKPRHNEPGLKLEATFIKRLTGYEHMLRFIDIGKYLHKYTYLVMQLAGLNLVVLRMNCPEKRFSLATTLLLAAQCMSAIETVHVFGFLHRDVKPENFALGFNENEKRTVYMLDFGLIRRFRLKDGKMRKKRSKARFRGSLDFASPNAHQSKDLGRVDDLWGWLYTLVEMRTGKLPWEKLQEKEEIGEMKENITKEELFADMEERELFAIYENMLTLEFEDEPPYAMYRTQFEKNSKRHKYTQDTPYDWEEGGDYHKKPGYTIVFQPYYKETRRVIPKKHKKHHKKK